jgi:hypothetical protein
MKLWDVSSLRRAVIAVRAAALVVCCLLLPASLYTLIVQPDTDRSLHFCWHTLDVTTSNGTMFFGYLRHSAPGGVSEDPFGFRYTTWSGHSRLWGWGYAYHSLLPLGGFYFHKFGAMAVDDLPVENEHEFARAVFFPTWFVAVASAIFPGLLLGRAARRVLRRRKPGVCATCGYDLNGISGPCPECGNAPVHS